MLLYMLECARVVKAFKRLYASKYTHNTTDDSTRFFLQNYRGLIATTHEFKRIFNASDC